MEKQEKLLIVDDNQKYKQLIEQLYLNKNYQIDWVKSAQEGKNILKEKGIQYYHAIVTDITMENQTSGLFFAIKLRKQGYNGEITIASTGFDFPIVLAMARRVLGWFGIDFLIPKVSLKKGKPIILACR